MRNARFDTPFDMFRGTSGRTAASAACWPCS